MDVAVCSGALGVITWLIYSLLFTGGYPDDVIFGTLGHAIAAWCYITLFVYWINVSRHSKLGTVEPTNNG